MSVGPIADPYRRDRREKRTAMPTLWPRSGTCGRARTPSDLCRTGTTCVTKAPPASWETASTCALQQTQRYVNVTDEELGKGLEVSTRTFEKWRALQDSNLWPSAPEAEGMSQPGTAQDDPA